MIRAVFFDLDDTLRQTSSTRELRARLAHEALASAGHVLDFDAFYASIVEYDPVIEYIRGMDSVLEEHGLHETDAGLLASKLWLFQGCEHLVQPYEGCVELLAAISSVQKLGVITNGPILPQTIKFEALKFVAHFHPNLFVTSEHAGCYKPDERIFRYALERAGVEPHEAIHIGDGLETDVAGALGAGMRAIWFNPEGREPEDGIVPDATISSYAELPPLLENWSD